jgi:SAM-dependent methyltransferase
MSTGIDRVGARCPACTGATTIPFLDLGLAPVFCNVQWPTRADAQAAAKGPLFLAACIECGHIFNLAFDAHRVAYAPGYENSQHASSVFRAFAERLVDRLIARYDVRHRAVVDIGCGRGDLLALFCERGENRGFGFDPSYRGAAEDSGGRPFQIWREYFDAEHATAIRPALVCCRHVLEHVEDPTDFLVRLRNALEACGDAILYLEVPSGEALLNECGIWDYLYEHVSYFSGASLEKVLVAAGFEVMHLQHDFGGQFLCAEVRVARQRSDRTTSKPFREESLRAAARGMGERLHSWREWARSLDSAVTLWGAGSKGVMFLNLLGLSAPEPIDWVIDQSVDKHGRFVSGTGQEIVSPESLRGSKIRQIVLMNGIYESEVRRRIDGLGVAAELRIAWP